MCVCVCVLCACVNACERGWGDQYSVGFAVAFVAAAVAAAVFGGGSGDCVGGKGDMRVGCGDSCSLLIFPSAMMILS